MAEPFPPLHTSRRERSSYGAVMIWLLCNGKEYASRAFRDHDAATRWADHQLVEHIKLDHVQPAVEDATQAFVFDPKLEPERLAIPRILCGNCGKPLPVTDMAVGDNMALTVRLGLCPCFTIAVTIVKDIES